MHPLAEQRLIVAKRVGGRFPGIVHAPGLSQRLAVFQEIPLIEQVHAADQDSAVDSRVTFTTWHHWNATDATGSF